MFLVGIQEEQGRGLWVSIVLMDRMQVVKKYRVERHFFQPCTGLSDLEAFLAGLHRDGGLVVRKKQFSQLGRPPKYVQAGPRVLLRPEGGREGEGLVAMLQALSFPAPFLCLNEKRAFARLSCEGVAEEALVQLVHGLCEEKRLDLAGTSPEVASPAFLSTGLALWGGEKIWRMVRYGG